MHAILASVGTDGDVIPYVGLGAELRRRGHRVTLVVAEPWRQTALDLGLEFAPVVTAEEDRQFVVDPDLWHPLKGPAFLAKWGTQFLRRQYDLLAGLASQPGSVMVANPGLLPARVVSEKLGAPMASLILQPWMIKSVCEPPVMPAGLTLPRWAPRPVGHLYWRMFDLTVDVLIGKELARLRESLSLPPVRRVFDWWLSPDLVVGMFPHWYGPPQPDWLGQIRLAGFPMFDGRSDVRLPAAVEAFCRAGPPPVAFTFGTGMLHAEKIFRAAIEATAAMNRRAIFLTRHTDQLPAVLPPHVLQCPFAPFTKLFPLCAAIVHHGGVGTTAKALASGTPQLIVPRAFDQFDNAVRVKRLGAGDWIKPRKAAAGRLAAALEHLVRDDARRRCAPVAGRFASGGDALPVACDWLEELTPSARTTPQS